MGPDGSTIYIANSPAITYNVENNEYLVVWSGDDDTHPLVDNEQEIFSQRVDARTGKEIGDDFRLSDMGPDGDIHFSAIYPAVASSGQANSYLVVWEGDDDTLPLIDDEYEIFGQFLAFSPIYWLHFPAVVDNPYYYPK
jgi:hypothetical protein